MHFLTDVVHHYNYVGRILHFVNYVPFRNSNAPLQYTSCVNNTLSPYFHRKVYDNMWNNLSMKCDVETLNKLRSL